MPEGNRKPVQGRQNERMTAVIDRPAHPRLSRNGVPMQFFLTSLSIVGKNCRGTMRSSSTICELTCLDETKPSQFEEIKMSINSVTDSSVWIGQQFHLNQQPSQVRTDVQEAGGHESQVGRVHHHRGLGQALMQTLKELLLSIPSNSSIQSAEGDNYDSDRNGSGLQTGGVRNGMHNFMYALFQAIRSQEPSSSSNTSAYATGFEGSKFESGLSSLISQLASNSGSDNSQVADLQNAFNTLVRELQNSPSEGSSPQRSQTFDLQEFLSTLQQNLLSYRQPVSATGNVLNTLG